MPESNEKDCLAPYWVGEVFDTLVLTILIFMTLPKTSADCIVLMFAKLFRMSLLAKDLFIERV